MLIGLIIVALVVLVVPITVKKAEENIEIFLLAMGAIAMTISSRWDLPIVRDALVEPLMITAAVLIAGFLFRLAYVPLGRFVDGAKKRLGIPLLVGITVIVTSLLSSVITAIMAALVLVEIVNHLKLPRAAEVKVVVFACFGIGLGAALTPLGEPLSTITIAKLSGEPYNAGFWFLAEKLWMYILPGILVSAVLAAVFVRKEVQTGGESHGDAAEGLGAVLLRTLKVYVFVAALVLLGAGFKPFIDAFVTQMPFQGLFWLNGVSAFLDNATLAAAEIGPSLQIHQIESALLGLLIAGGILIPGNIPNIISAGKLKIRGKEWARIGVPTGLAMMAVCFVVILMVY
jgi:predicted cation transporter